MTPDASLTLALWVASALLAILTAAVGWLVRVVSSTATRVERLDVALYGERGDNGLFGRVRALEDDRRRGVPGYDRRSNPSPS